jgi:hypothetical protein
MKHSLIIIHDFKVKNQIRIARNLNPGVLQGSVFWCPKGLHIDAEFIFHDAFSLSPWVTFYPKGVVQSF